MKTIVAKRKTVAQKHMEMGSKLPYKAPEDLIFADVHKVWEIGYSTSYPYKNHKVPKNAMLVLAPTKDIVSIYGDKSKVAILTGLKEPEEIKPSESHNWPTNATKKVKNSKKAVRFRFDYLDEMTLGQFKRLFPVQYEMRMNSTGVYLRK